MMHIHEATFYAWVFEKINASTAERIHLEECTACQTQWASIQKLAHELQIAKASTPTAAAFARYFQFYDQIQPAPTLWQQVAEFITAQLQWDGRRQPAWQGVRNSYVASYRLLYATEQAEIELLVAPREGQFQIEGEVVPLTEPTTLLPARYELQNVSNGETVYSAECQRSGRFHLDAVPSGHYRLCFVPSTGATIVINDLELREQ